MIILYLLKKIINRIFVALKWKHKYLCFLIFPLFLTFKVSNAEVLKKKNNESILLQNTEDNNNKPAELNINEILNEVRTRQQDRLYQQSFNTKTYLPMGNVDKKSSNLISDYGVADGEQDEYGQFEDGNINIVRSINMNDSEYLSSSYNSDDFIAEWKMYTIEKSRYVDKIRFENIERFLKKFNNQIPMKDVVIETASDVIEKSQLTLEKKFLWLYVNNPKYRTKFSQKGLNKENYKDFFIKNKINNFQKLKLYINSTNDFEIASEMIWQKQYIEAFRLTKKLSEKHLKIIQARLYLSQSSKKFDKYSLALKECISKNYHLSDDGLLYMYIKYLAKKEQYDVIFQKLISKIMLIKNHDNEWWDLKELLIIELLKKGDYNVAYNLAMPTDNLDSQNLARSRWLSGFIALKFLKEYKIAVEFFKSVYYDFTYSATKSRGAYWAARGYEAMGDSQLMQEWYEKASEYPLTFYGQEAILKNMNMEDERLFYKDFETANNVNFFAEQMLIFNKIFNDIKLDLEIINKSLNSSVQKKLESNFLWLGGVYLYKINKKEEAMAFFETLIKTQDRFVSMFAIYKLKEILSYYDYRIVKNLVSFLNIPLVDVLYNNELPFTRYNHKPLIYAIIQRESGFKLDAISPVGALGLMQIMPSTAKQTTSELGLKYSYVKLLSNAEYNVEIGSYYINKLLDLFDNSYPLAIGSYNGGPNAVRMWLDRNEFTQSTDNIIDWIELVSYKETRNYIMRVLENEIIYRYITRFGNFSEHKE